MPAIDPRVEQLLLDLGNRHVVAPRPDLAALVNWSQSAQMPIHRWLRYREGFSPGLIKELQLGQRILDPFCGSGSTLVGSVQMGRESTGIDVNPLATFAAKVKLTPLSPEDVVATHQVQDQFRQDLDGVEPLPPPGLSIQDKVFEPLILKTLLRLRRLVLNPARSKPLRNFLALAWLSILEEVGSYFKEGNGIKYRNKKRTRNGYVDRVDGEWQLQRFGANQQQFVLDAFGARLGEMLEDVPEWDNWDHTLVQKIVQGNSIETMKTFDAGQFDSVLFSPPYANRFDYFESMKVELWFGEFIHSYGELTALRKQSLRSHLGAALEADTTSLPEVAALIELLDPKSYAKSSRVDQLLHGYFEDMRSMLESCRRVLTPGGTCNVVVGNSAYGGVIIPTDVLIAMLGPAAGFDNVKVIPIRHLTVAPQQRKLLEGMESYMRESVVVFS